MKTLPESFTFVQNVYLFDFSYSCRHRLWRCMNNYSSWLDNDSHTDWYSWCRKYPWNTHYGNKKRLCSLVGTYRFRPSDCTRHGFCTTCGTFGCSWRQIDLAHMVCRIEVLPSLQKQIHFSLNIVKTENKLHQTWGYFTKVLIINWISSLQLTSLTIAGVAFSTANSIHAVACVDASARINIIWGWGGGHGH